MNNEELAKLSDAAVIEKMINGEISRNKNYDFFNTNRGRALHGKTKAILAIIEELKAGTKIVEEKKDGERFALKMANKEKNYTKTVFFDAISWKIFNTLRTKGADNGRNK